MKITPLDNVDSVVSQCHSALVFDFSDRLTGFSRILSRKKLWSAMDAGDSN